MEPETSRLICVDGFTEKPFIVDFKDATNYACFSPDDLGKILKALKRSGTMNIYRTANWKLWQAKQAKNQYLKETSVLTE